MQNLPRLLALFALPLTLAAASPAPQIVTLWREDCTPCRFEARLLPELARANPHLHFTLKALKGMPEHTHWPANITVEQAGEESFAALGDTRQQLPFSAAVDAAGNVCATRAGILGYQTVSTWSHQCAR